MKNPNWNEIRGPLLGWIARLNSMLQTYELPTLDGPLVLIASDYGGQHQDSRYITISLLLADLHKCAEWEIRRRVLRERFFLGTRRFSFKALNDRKRRAALPSFLQAADLINGLLVTFAISKKVTHMVTIPGQTFDDIHRILGLQARWRDSQLEPMLRVAHFVSFFIGGMGKPGQHIYWVSDQDEILANEHRAADVARIMAGLSNVYVHYEPGELGIGTAAIDPGDRVEEDLIGIADLAAGSVAEIVTVLSKSPRWLHENSGPIVLTGLKHKTADIADWLWSPMRNLKRLSFVFDSLEKDRLTMLKLMLHESRIIM